MTPARSNKRGTAILAILLAFAANFIGSDVAATFSPGLLAAHAGQPVETASGGYAARG